MVVFERTNAFACECNLPHPLLVNVPAWVACETLFCRSLPLPHPDGTPSPPPFFWFRVLGGALRMFRSCVTLRWQPLALPSAASLCAMTGRERGACVCVFLCLCVGTSLLLCLSVCLSVCLPVCLPPSHSHSNSRRLILYFMGFAALQKEL